MWATQSQTKTLICLLILALILPASGFIISSFVEQSYETRPPAGSDQNPESSGDIPEITSLDLEGLRARLKAQGENRAVVPSPETISMPTPIPNDIFVLTNGLIIDGTGAAPIPNGGVMLRGNRILAVGRLTDLPIPANAEVVDVAGQTIMPGIINAHVHYACDPLTRHHYLLDGVTAVCDLGTSLPALHNFEREYTRQNEPAARGFRAGPILTAPGGYPSMYHGTNWDFEVATPEQAEVAVNHLLDRGVDVIKIALEPGHPRHPWPVLTLEQVQTIVNTAHARGVLVRAHVRQAALLDIALTAGVDVIEHVPLPFCLEAEYQQMLEAGALHLAKQPELAAQLARMVEQEIVLVPTLDVTTCAVGDLPGLGPEEQRRIDIFLFEIVSHFRDMGGVVALGNDQGRSEMPLHEMELLQAAGLTPMEVIEAGTRHAAEVSGHGEELGTLEPGKLADLIVVDGNPLTDLGAMSRVVIVIKNGEIAFRAEKA